MRVLQRIRSWASDDEAGWIEDGEVRPRVRALLPDESKSWPRNKHVFWLCGPVGCGKSAISQALAEEFANRGRLLGSFFFFRGSGDRSKIYRLAVTLAIQMSASIPSTAPLVEAGMKTPGFEGMSAGDQLTLLIFEPLKQIICGSSSASTLPESGNDEVKVEEPKPRSERRAWRRTIFPPLFKRRSPGSTLGPGDSATPPQTPRPASAQEDPFLIILDGLDECEDRIEAAHLIDAILRFVGQHPQVPLRLFIASRIEEHIRARIERPAVHIENVVDHPSSLDIENVCRHTFEQAAKETRVIRAYGQQWPSDEEISQLVSHAGGSFIFISTLLRYILDPEDMQRDGLTPMERLKLALDMNPGLDGLYTELLQSAKHISHFQEVVLTLALLKTPFPISCLARLLHLPSFKVVNVFVPLQSIIHVPEDDDKTEVTIFHSSLREFILDEARSHDIFPTAERHSCRINLAYEVCRIGYLRSTWDEEHESEVEKSLVSYAESYTLNRPQNDHWKDLADPIDPHVDFLVSLGQQQASKPEFQAAFGAFSCSIHFPGEASVDSNSWTCITIPNVLRRAILCLERLQHNRGDRASGMQNLKLLEAIYRKPLPDADTSIHRCMVMHSVIRLMNGVDEYTTCSSSFLDPAYYTAAWIYHLANAIGSDDDPDDSNVLSFLLSPYPASKPPANRPIKFTLDVPYTLVAIEHTVKVINGRVSMVWPFCKLATD